jgi:hypothetical protein
VYLLISENSIYFFENTPNRFKHVVFLFYVFSHKYCQILPIAHHMSTTCHCCLLCGDQVTAGKGRIHSLEDIQTFVHKCIQPTEYHFRTLLNLGSKELQSEHVKLCLFCSNWKRHTAATYKPHKKNKEFTPLDHLIMYTYEPGAVQEPDHRCLKRLVAAAISVQNPFRNVIPYPSQKIMQACTDFTGEELPAQIALRWWEYNQRTPFFRNKKTAKIVRRALRQQKLYSNLEKRPRIRWRH